MHVHDHQRIASDTGMRSTCMEGCKLNSLPVVTQVRTCLFFDHFQLYFGDKRTMYVTCRQEISQHRCELRLHEIMCVCKRTVVSCGLIGP